MRKRKHLIVLISVLLAVLVGATSAMAKERVVQLLLPDCS